MPLYFAYGANMDAAAMALRCPVSRLVGRGRLPRHRFIVMREGYASVVRDPGFTVHGVLWALAADDIPALDRYEGVAGGLYAKANLPVTGEGGVRRALIYLGRSTAPGRPRPGYLEAVMAAARAARLPPAYLREIGGWARGAPARDSPARAHRGPPRRNDPMGATRTVCVVITGRVQGVSYRAWTRDEARALGLTGFVRNRDDGAVEAVFGGPAKAVARMVALCRQGPAGARVADVSVSERAEPPDARGFEILPG